MSKARLIRMLIASGAVKPNKKGDLVTVDKKKADEVKRNYLSIISTPKGWKRKKQGAKKEAEKPKPKPKPKPKRKPKRKRTYKAKAKRKSKKR